MNEQHTTFGVLWIDSQNLLFVTARKKLKSVFVFRCFICELFFYSVLTFYRYLSRMLSGVWCVNAHACIWLNQFSKMNCATITPDERYAYDRERSHDRRTSRGLASCLRGESEEYYDFEAEGKKKFHLISINAFYYFSYY